MRENALTYKRLKRVLKDYVGGEVSSESVEYIQEFIDNLLKSICQEAIKERDIENKQRKDYYLRPLKRFDKSLFINCSVKYLNTQSDLTIGEDGQHNSETSLSKANER
ncbi:MAG: hypothetical protein NT038_07920 [Euryarchaeota archaeon]|nr:hypothetical protein [Euryarchaeota archaeon]